jgi:hypothetical protein
LGGVACDPERGGVCHGIIDGSGADDLAVLADLDALSDKPAPMDVLAEHDPLSEGCLPGAGSG